MQSLTKVDLSEDQLRLAVRTAFGPSAELKGSEEFPEGWFNTIYALDLGHTRVVLKLAPKAGVPVLRYERDLLATEVEVYRLLAEVEGVKVPRVLFHEPTGQVLGLPFFFMERVEGPTYSKVKANLSEGEKQAIERRLGAMNRRIHSVTGELFGSLLPGGFRSTRWYEVVGRLYSDVLADGRDKGTRLPWEERKIVALLEKHADALDLVTVPRLIHWDLHDGNTFVDGTEIKAVIDGDRALWGDPLMEVYFSGLLGPVHFTEGYGPGVADAPGASARRAVYDVYLGLIMLVECGYRGFTEEHRAWAFGNLTQALEHCSGL